MAAPPRPRRSRAGDWIAPALWFALAVALARAAVLFAMEHVAHESPIELVRHRLGVALPPLLGRASALGLGTAALASLAARAGRRGAARALLTPVLAAATWVLLSGIGAGDASRQVGLDTDRGVAVAAALAVLSCALAAWTVARATRADGARPALLRTAPALVLLALLTASARFALTGFGDEMPLREVVSRPAQGESWRIARARDDAPPRSGTITPSVDYALDGADLPSVVLPPPAEVAFGAPREEGLWLAGRAGIDHVTLQRNEERLRDHAVLFELLLDGKPAFRREIPFERVGKWASSEWVEIGAGGALPVPAGAEIVLRTALLGPSGEEVLHGEPLDAGFGGLAFERRWSRPRRPSSPEEPNLVLIVMDTQRKDRTSVHGYGRDTTPRLAALAGRGLVFDEAHATSSWTWPSTASLLTGQLPHEHGVLNEYSCFLGDGLLTLAESLQRRGFTTGAFSANPLIVPDRNFDQGFEVFDHGRGAVRPTEVVLPPALDWLEAVAGTRFFLYLHLADPHAPLEPLPEARARFAPDVPADLDPGLINVCHDALLAGEGHTADGRRATHLAVPEEEQRWISDLYDACVWSGDHHVGRVLDALERLGLSDETVIAYTSDHGEELFDHGFATHGQNLHGSLVDVPLILAGPGVPSGARVATPVSNRHLAPSLARLLGGEPLGPPDALDLIALAAEEGPAPPVLFTTEKGWWNGRSVQPIHGLRRGDLVLHWAPEASPWGSETPVEGGEWRLYDRSIDPGEQRDVGPERADAARELRESLERGVEELRARRAAPSVAAGEGTLEMLRAIGYLDE